VQRCFGQQKFKFQTAFDSYEPKTPDTGFRLIEKFKASFIMIASQSLAGLNLFGCRVELIVLVDALFLT
jgi:hypothetical protein